MREVVGRRPAQDIFRDDRPASPIEVQQITQTILDSYELGVRVSQITIEDAAPPAEVADAFDEVQRAEQDEDRFQEEARQYANTLLGDARGQAAQMREDAAAYKNRVVQEAEGEAARFIVGLHRICQGARSDAQAAVPRNDGAGAGRLREGASSRPAPAGTGVVPYLPLPELRSGTTTTATPAPRN